MTDCIVELGLFWQSFLLNYIDPYLSLSNQDIPIPEVHQNIFVICLKPIFGSYHFEKFPTFGLTGILQFFKKGYYLLRGFSLGFAPQEVVDVKDKLFSSLSRNKFILCQFY